MSEAYGSRLRARVEEGRTVAFIGVYDAFSASLAARHFDGLFISGYSFAASFYGLPDVGFIAWSDIVAFTQRVRALLPRHHLLVDIDDGYCDPEVACHVVRLLEQTGASAVVLEDQQRPRRCGHFDGKQIMPLDAFVDKLRAVLDVRRDLFVIARTDASGEDEILARVAAFAQAGADAVLVDGLRDLSLLARIRAAAARPVMFNQIAGGKSPVCTLDQLHDAGVSLVNYSTPCLFAAQAAIATAMAELKANGGRVGGGGGVELGQCSALLRENLAWRYTPPGREDTE